MITAAAVHRPRGGFTACRGHTPGGSVLVARSRRRDGAGDSGVVGDQDEGQPEFLPEDLQQVMISSRASSSRLPVGSSASSAGGFLDQAAAMATAAAGRRAVPGAGAAAGRRARRRPGPARLATPAAGPFLPGAGRGPPLRSPGGQGADQIEGLEDEADRGRAHLVSWPSRICGQVLAAELDGAEVGRSRRPGLVAGRSCRGRWSPDGEPVAVVDFMLPTAIGVVVLDAADPFFTDVTWGMKDDASRLSLSGDLVRQR